MLSHDLFLRHIIDETSRSASDHSAPCRIFCVASGRTFKPESSNGSSGATGMSADSTRSFVSRYILASMQFEYDHVAEGLIVPLDFLSGLAFQVGDDDCLFHLAPH